LLPYQEFRKILRKNSGLEIAEIILEFPVALSGGMFLLGQGVDRSNKEPSRWLSNQSSGRVVFEFSPKFNSLDFDEVSDALNEIGVFQGGGASHVAISTNLEEYKKMARTFIRNRTEF
jgi:hypothetical protein